jgi:hypothetical protein
MSLILNFLYTEISIIEGHLQTLPQSARLIIICRLGTRVCSV